MKKIGKFLSSMPFAITLLVLLAAACALCSTIPQGQTYDQYAAQYGERTAGFIIEQLREDTTPEAIKKAMFDKYDASYEQISADVDAVIAQLRENGIIEE